jgi:hypothetical protein
MGAGIALECRFRFPEMFNRYTKFCEENRIDVGILWIYKSPNRWVLNFPTKKHWRMPSREEYLHAGLKKFMDTYEAKGIESIAFPVLGAQNGGLDTSTSLDLMQSYLSECKVPVEIYKYDPTAVDDLYDKFKTLFLETPSDELKLRTGLKNNYLDIIRKSLKDSSINQLNQLAKANGIGVKTLEKAFAYVLKADDSSVTANITSNFALQWDEPKG